MSGPFAASIFQPPSVAASRVPALGGGQDDGPRLTTALLAGNVQLVGQTYTIHTPFLWPAVPDRILYGDPATILHGTMATGGAGDYLNSVIRGMSAAVGGGYTANLTSNASAWSFTVAVDAKPTAPQIAAGLWIELAGAASNVAMFARVLSASGNSSPYTLTLDRPIRPPFHSALTTALTATATQIAAPVRPRIEGRGMLITGDGDRAIEGNWIDGEASGIRVDASLSTTGFGAIICSADIGSTFKWKDITIDGGGLGASAGLGAESAIVTADNVQIARVGIGLFAPDAIDSEFTKVKITNCTTGAELVTGSDHGTIFGARRCKLSGTIDGCTTGVTVASPENDLADLSVSGCVTAGISVGFGASIGAPSGGPVRLRGVRTRENQGPGLIITGSGDVEAYGCVFQDDGKTGPTYAIHGSGTGHLLVSGGEILLTSDVAVIMVYADTAGRITLDGGLRMVFPAGASTNCDAIIVQGAATFLDVGEVRMEGAPRYVAYLYTGSGATIRHGLTLSYQSTARNGITLNGNTESSWGSPYVFT